MRILIPTSRNMFLRISLRAISLFTISGLALSALFFTAGCIFETREIPLVSTPVKIVTPSALAVNAQLGRGINVGNALDAPSEGAWGVVLKAEWFRQIKDSGFTTVRIPIRWDTHASATPPYVIDSVFMARAQWAVDQALANQLHVIIDMHHYDSLSAHPDAERPRFLAMWKQIAHRFAKYPPELLFELNNEPTDKLDVAAWNLLMRETIDTLRKIQPVRTLVVGTAEFGGLSGLSGLQLPDDSNLIVTVHYYEPFTFTHQGAAFQPGASAWLGTTWRATPPQRASVDQDIKTIQDWAAQNHRPIFLGEFGAYQAADSVSRAMYLEYLSTQFTAAGFSWAAWNFSSDFGLVDTTGVWRGYLTKALLHPGHNAQLDSIVKATKPLDLSTYFVFDDFEDSLADLPSSAYAWDSKHHIPVDSSQSHYYTFYSDTSLLTDPAGHRLLQYFEAGPGKAPRNFSGAIGNWGYTGKGLHVKGRLKGSNYPWVGFGAGLLGGWDSTFVDLTKMTAIRFRAKGRGDWVLQIVSDTVYNKYPKADNWGNFCVTFKLKDQWEDFVFPAEYFAPKKYSVQAAKGLTWAQARNKIMAFEFENGQSYGQKPDDSLEMYLDDIQIIGMQAKDFGL